MNINISCANCKHRLTSDNYGMGYRHHGAVAKRIAHLPVIHECWAMDDAIGVLLDPDFVNIDTHFCALHSDRDTVNKMREAIL